MTRLADLEGAPFAPRHIGPDAGERAAMLGSLTGAGLPPENIIAGLTATSIDDVLTQVAQGLEAGVTDFDQYAVEQIFFESKDGTKVPMYIVYKKGLERDGSNP